MTDVATPPPSNVDAERWVLGSVLKSRLAIGNVAWLPVVDFYDARNQAIWRAMLDLWERAVPIDYATVANRLQAADLKQANVGIADLAEIDLGVPTAAHAEHYAVMVRDSATQRRYISAAQKIAEAAYRPGCDIERLTERADAILATAKARQSRRYLRTPDELAQSIVNDLTLREEGKRTAVMTGLHDLDGMTLGLEAGRLYLVMSPPGHGKTELSIQVAIHAAAKHGPVLFASLEMTEVELGMRYIRITRGIDRNRLAITSGPNGLTADEWETVTEALNEMRQGRLHVSSPDGPYTTSDLRADALDVRVTAGKPVLIVADYVQRFANHGANREQEVGSVVRGLKSLAREMGCAVLAPVQPNRDFKHRVSNPRPVLSDLRESGQLEAEADVVLGLYRDEKHNPESRDRGIMEIHILKNRSGAGDDHGCRKVVWRGHRYENYAPQPTGAMVA